MTDKFADWTLSARNGEVTINGTTDTLAEAEDLLDRLTNIVAVAHEQSDQIHAMAAAAGLTDTDDLKAHDSERDTRTT
jgi:hypothetical protein